MRGNLGHLDNLTQNPQQNRLFLDGFKIAALIILIILPSTAPANRQRHPQRTSVAFVVNPRRGQSGASRPHCAQSQPSTPTRCESVGRVGRVGRVGHDVRINQKRL